METDLMETKAIKTIGRRSYIAASVTFIMIGLLHTYVQLTDMSATKIEADLDAIGMVDGIDATALDLWHGIGLLMGFFSICVGANNLAALRAAANGRPPVGVCINNMAMLAAITVVGALYLGPTQMFGGPVGILAFGIAGLETARHGQKVAAPVTLGDHHQAVLVTA